MSHAWVVGKSKTTTGSAVLNSDPQTKVSIPSIWYEIHIKGQSFDVRGIGVAGCPGFMIGWNHDVAWGATALGGDQADIFRLKMISETEYEFDRKIYTMDISDEIIKVKGGADRAIQVKNTIIVMSANFFIISPSPQNSIKRGSTNHICQYYDML